MGADGLVYFRTDGNAQIATGHLVRCFSLGLACRSLGLRVCFLVSDAQSRTLMEELFISHDVDIREDFFLQQLNTASYDNLERELDEVISLIRTSSEPGVFFLDSYFVTEHYLSALRPYIKLVYLDDLMLFDYPVDLLVNYDVIPQGKLSSYEEFYGHAGRLLLGASYTPLRSQFADKTVSVHSRISHVLVTTGGSDPYHFTLSLVERLNKLCQENAIASDPLADDPECDQSAILSAITFHLLVGKMNTDSKQLCRLAKATDAFVTGHHLPRLLIHQQVSDMASLMSSCDLAVSAAGTTLYELCALGVPSISFTMADNQLTTANAFAAVEAIPCAGDLRTGVDAVLDEVLRFITESSPEKRKAAHETMSSLIDGKGALRIAEAIAELLKLKH